MTPTTSCPCCGNVFELRKKGKAKCRCGNHGVVVTHEGETWVDWKYWTAEQRDEAAAVDD